MAQPCYTTRLAMARASDTPTTYKGPTMPRVCEFTGKKTTAGLSYTHRGKAKYLGGVGTKVTGKTKRTFKPNIQVINALMEDGSVRKVKASTRAIRNGLVVKPLKRRFAYKPDAEQS